MTDSTGWCRFCESQCFVERVIPAGKYQGWKGLMATCTAGRAYSRQQLDGYDDTNSIDPNARPAREISWSNAPRFHRSDDEYDDLRRMGEMVRQLRELSASEARMRTVLERIAREYGHVLGPDCDCCPGCMAKAALEHVIHVDPNSAPEWLELAEQAKNFGSSWEKC